ncbi:GNAT family N-acetyltransferase [Clostridium sp. AL.422]|uniref:GNAT family N-acetyltransferase n=1 Tax=Clostridium TaxID=1485 RepID=UPI00293DF66F|nr:MULTISPECIES: GNAT family N-acetyltransferase [unclassified Clostridium]MDV4150163.1 GNAT family N-acetyltransferase [Clostridium sp. AL.422]
MKGLGTITLETERLILRKFKMEDAEAMYKNWASDSEVTKFLTWPAHSSVDVTKIILEDWISNYKNDDFYNWAIILKENGDEPIGSIGAVEKNERVNMVHIGYCVGKNWWNRGITSEALRVLIGYFIEEVGVNRVEARHDPNNPNSGKVMMKCGMKYEGTMRQADINNQGICDYSMYGILSKEYMDLK